MGPLTCAAEALGDYLGPGDGASSPRFFPRFEDVREALLAGEIDVALLPHCHPVTTEMLFDPRFEFDMGAAFDRPNPPLHLACAPGSGPTGDAARCAAVPFIWPLVASLQADLGRLQLLPMSSNPAAAAAVAEGQADLSITNQPSLNSYGLRSLRVLKHVALRWFPVSLAGPGGSSPPDGTGHLLVPGTARAPRITSRWEFAR